jgi:hypothetical protein
LRVFRVRRRAFASFRLGIPALIPGVIVGAACLGSLPDPSVCPAPPTHALCTLTNPDPNSGEGGTCDCPDRDCDGGADKCVRTKASCYVPPDCPPAVRSAASTAQCYEANPSPELSQLSDCACGSLACATACDGEGIVWGQMQNVSFTLQWQHLPERGSLGLMVRARGGGGMLAVTVFPVDQGSPSVQLDPVTLGDSFTDSISTSLYTWTTGSLRPATIQLLTDATSSAEVDCVVPYLAP